MKICENCCMKYTYNIHYAKYALYNATSSVVSPPLIILLRYVNFQNAHETPTENSKSGPDCSTAWIAEANIKSVPNSNGYYECFGSWEKH